MLISNTIAITIGMQIRGQILTTFPALITPQVDEIAQAVKVSGRFHMIGRSHLGHKLTISYDVSTNKLSFEEER